MLTNTTANSGAGAVSGAALSRRWAARLVMGLGLGALAACGGEGGGATAEQGPCSSLDAIIQARGESLPFESLRGDPAMLGDMALDDKFQLTAQVLGASCTNSVMSGFPDPASDIHLVNCPLYQNSSSFDRDGAGEEARAMFAQASEAMEACLGEGWAVEPGRPDSDFEVYESLEFNPVGEPQRAGGFTIDSAYIKLMYSPFMRGPGRSSGWFVELQFQQVAPAQSAD
jgi:hypothetical protein